MNMRTMERRRSILTSSLEFAERANVMCQATAASRYLLRTTRQPLWWIQCTTPVSGSSSNGQQLRAGIPGGSSERGDGKPEDCVALCEFFLIRGTGFKT